MKWDAIRQEVMTSAATLHVEQTLRSFAVSTKHLLEERKLRAYEFFLLELDSSAPSIEIHSYKQSSLKIASKEYLKRERATREDETKDVVLVAASSIRALKEAYRNYFADTDEFLRNMNKVFAADCHPMGARRSAPVTTSGCSRLRAQASKLAHVLATDPRRLYVRQQ